MAIRNPSSPEDLRELFREFGIRYDLWGGRDDPKRKSSLSKPFDFLYNEYKLGASRFEVKDGRLVRIVTVVDLQVYDPSKSSMWYHLRQTCQEIDGNLKFWQIPRGITEKVRNGDGNVVHTARRALTSIAGYKKKLPDIHPENSRSLGLYYSRSFPGLLSTGDVIILACMIPRKLINPAHEFRCDRPDGGRSHFKWTPVSHGDVPIALRKHIRA